MQESLFIYSRGCECWTADGQFILFASGTNIDIDNLGTNEEEKYIIKTALHQYFCINNGFKLSYLMSMPQRIIT